MRAPLAAGLVLLMAGGSISLRLGIPIGVLYAASQLASTTQPSMGLYFGTGLAIAVLMFLTAQVLQRLDAAYARLTGAHRDEIYRPGWLRSMRGERTSRRGSTILDVVMIVSVGLALLALAVWFFAFAGSSLPGP